MAQKPAKPTGKTATAKPRAAAPKAPKRSTTKAAIKKPVAAAKAKALKPAQPPAPPAPRAPNAKVKAKPLAKNVELTKRQLLDRIVTESGMKKGDARTVLDAVLSGLRDAIADGHDIAASPLGNSFTSKMSGVQISYHPPFPSCLA